MKRAPSPETTPSSRPTKTQRAPKQVTYALDENENEDPHNPNVDQIVYEEELLDMLDLEERDNVADYFKREFRSTEAVISDCKRIKKNNKVLETLQDLEDFYGEDDNDQTEMDEIGRAHV